MRPQGSVESSLHSGFYMYRALWSSKSRNRLNSFRSYVATMPKAPYINCCLATNLKKITQFSINQSIVFVTSRFLCTVQ